MKGCVLSLVILIILEVFSICKLSLLAEEIPLPAETKIAIPRDNLTKVEWVVPPLRNPLLRDFQGFSFEVDPKGEPWVLIKGKYLVNPLRRVAFQVEEKLIDFVFLDTGEAIALTENAIGFLSNRTDKMYRLNFIPVIQTQSKTLRLFCGKKESLYFISKDITQNVNQVYILKSKKDKGEIKKLFETKEEINAICEDKEVLYLAIKNLVLKIRIPDGETKALFKHRSIITDVKCSEKGKLFYTTFSSVGIYDGVRAVDFIHASNPKIKLSNNNLYVFLPQNLGVFRIIGVGNLQFK